MKSLLGLIVALVIFGLLVWGSDRVTLQGERTVYTVNCEGGTWEGLHCSGRLAVGDRYAFRASPRRGEVIYWTRGSRERSGTYSDCSVVDRDNWTCNVRADQKGAITYAMVNGRPLHVGAGLALPFHDVAKWKWWLIDVGLPMSDADG